MATSLLRGSGIVLAEDLDLDGDTDFVLGSALLQSQVLENLGDGSFARHPGQPVPVDQIVARGDLDGDGDIDFVSIGPLRLLRNDRTSLVDVTATNFVAAGPLPAWINALIDFDRDGDLDLVTPGRLFLNSGGVLSEVVPCPLPVIAVHLQTLVADIDADGHSDILLPTRHGLMTWMWRTGTYVDETGLRMPVLADDFDAAIDLDFDADRDTDFVLLGSTLVAVPCCSPTAATACSRT